MANKKDGWDALMCRYKFRDGKCAHPSNMALECVGEDKCRFLEDSDSESPPEISKKENNIPSSNKSVRDDGGCPHTKTGIYCKKYGYFHCAGEENCEDPEDYMEHLEKHQEKFQNVNINKKSNETPSQS